MVYDYSSQVNPNLSSTNLLNLSSSTKPKPSRIQEPKPGRLFLNSNSSFTAISPGFSNFSQFQLPLTPPVSNTGTPVKERDSYPLPKFLNKGQDQLKTISLESKWLPPIDLKICILCFAWYFCSAISGNSTKSILKQFNYSVTLTEVQFLLNCFFCLVLLLLILNNKSVANYFPVGFAPNLNEMKSVKQFVQPNRLVINTTLPMGIFQFVGHLTSHKATSMIPVSMVNTVKALAPLTTVLTYRFMFQTKYKLVTYLTLIPLVIGIMLTCYKPKKSASNAIPSYKTGLFYGFVSMLIFVSQNIFAKKILTVIDKSASNDLPIASKPKEEKKHDKLTILFYCSLIGFIFTLPVYIILEFKHEGGISLFKINFTIFSIMILNGLSHFLQSLLAFQILGSISPVNYSIANMMKRIVVICVAILWEGQTVTYMQGYGLGLTMIGLYCYDRWGTRHL